VTFLDEVSSLAEIQAPFEPEGLPEGQAASGERTSPEALFNAHADFVYRALRGFGLPPADAEDAVQEVFIVAYRRADEGQVTFPKAWLFRVAWNVARNLRRARRADRLPGDDDPDELPDVHAAGPLDQALQSERRKLLYELLDQLDEPLRVVFVAAEIEQLTGPETAEALTLPLTTVKHRLRMARQAFEDALRRHHARARPREDQKP